jgi:uncharacterized protein
MSRRSAPVKFGPAEVLLGWIIAILLHGIATVVLATATGYADPPDGVDPPLWLRLAGVPFLWAALIAVAVVLVRSRGTGSLRSDLGFAVRPGDIVLGAAVGVVTQLVFIKLLYLGLDALGLVRYDEIDEEARKLTDPAEGWLVVALVAVVTIGAPIVEELFYRGLMLRAFQARISEVLSIGMTAIIFALAHFQRVQFAGLLLFGVVLGYLTFRTRRLGPAIFAHAAFNLVTLIELMG